MPVITLDQETCINCKTCVLTCPLGVYQDKLDFIEILNPDDCIICMGCVAACPVSAIEIK